MNQGESVVAEAHKGLRIIVPTKPSRPVRITDMLRVLIDGFRIRFAMLSPFPGRWPKAASISHCQIEEKDPLRFFVVDKDFAWYFGNRVWKPRIIMNPEIVWHGNYFFKHREGCMSFPFDHEIKMARWEIVEMRYWTFFGPRTKKFYEFRAAMCQHEIDHMNFVTIEDKKKEGSNKKPDHTYGK